MILIDTNIIYSFYNKDDNENEIATIIFNEIMSGTYGIPVILDYVFNELMTLLYIRTRKITNCKLIGDQILKFVNNNLIRLKSVNSRNIKDAYDFFTTQKISKRNKFLSFVDCIILVYARNYEIDYIATFEGNFNRSNAKIIGS